MKFGGQAIRRIEDDRLLTGGGRFTDDLRYPDLAYGTTLRSPYGHARIASIDTAAALAMPGVLAIYTHADIATYGPLPCQAPLSAPLTTPRPILADGTVRFVGEAIAFVVAESREAARQGAEAIELDFDELPAVVGLDEAIAEGAPAIWPEAKGNIVFDWSAGDAAAAERAAAGAAHVTRLRIVQNRIAPTSMEVRAAVGRFEDGLLHLDVGSQGVAGMRGAVAGILKIEPTAIHVVTGDVGGGFGMKMWVYSEYALVLHAARLLGRPVKWTGERGDAFQSDTHGRAMVSDAALSLDAEGHILALQVDTLSDLGAYQSQFGPAIQTMAGGKIIGGVYRIPAIYNRVRGVMTNTAPVDAYRGAGRPESTYIMERLLEQAARETGRTAADIRRTNLLRSDELPHANGLGLTFDVGDFPAVLEKSLANADEGGFAARKAEAERRGRRYGRGLCYYVEIAGGGGTNEFADIRVAADGIVEAAVGTQSNGQGHETAYTQVLADRLGLPFEQIRIVQGDTARLDQGNGTGGSRSLTWGGGALVEAAKEVIERGKDIAADELGADIDYAEGVFRGRATNRTLSLSELAARFPGGLDGRSTYETGKPAPTFPNGCHIAEVEVDPETGHVAVARYCLVDDFGTVMNPMLVEGQVHGGVAQGLGQALLENIVYDDGAQLLTGSFMDYGIPRADDMPRAIGFDTLGVPNPNNPLGTKGCGEAGTIGAMPSIINALIDALDGTQIEMPATPEKVWRICRNLMARRAA